MSTSIYYFSATGNSMTTAYALAQGIEDCAVIPIAATRNLHKVCEQADAVGFVFPIYYGDMPYIVRELINKMTFNPDTYIFIVPTFRAGSGTVTGKMDDLLRTRGQKLSLYMGVPMPANSAVSPPEKDAANLAAQPENVQKALEAILERRVEDYRTTEVIGLRPVDFANNFRGVTAEDTCVGCGTCVEICPMNNIRLMDGKADIGDNCITCLTCYHWCPTNAIWMSKDPMVARRPQYHNPDVTLDDIRSQKN